MDPPERAFLSAARVGHLATADADAHPHVVPVCFALVADATRVVSAIDEKPKSTRELRRVRNIRENPRAMLLVDHYETDWSRLAWVQVDGRASVLAPGAAGHEPAVAALTAKYAQYADHALTDRPALALDVEHTRSWGGPASELA